MNPSVPGYAVGVIEGIVIEFVQTTRRLVVVGADPELNDSGSVRLAAFTSSYRTGTDRAPSVPRNELGGDAPISIVETMAAVRNKRVPRAGIGTPTSSPRLPYRRSWRKTDADRLERLKGAGLILDHESAELSIILVRSGIH